MATHTHHRSRKGWIIIISLIAILAIILMVPLMLREEVPAPSVYTFGMTAALLPLSEEAAAGFTNATVQYIALGEKPLLRIENMDVTACSGASVAISRIPADSLSSEHLLVLGHVRYASGNTNYEVPYTLNTSLYPIVQVWCNASQSFVARADFRQTR